MHTTRDELEGMRNLICAQCTHVCIWCERLTVVSADFDQAFEMCDVSRVMPAYTRGAALGSAQGFIGCSTCEIALLGHVDDIVSSCSAGIVSYGTIYCSGPLKTFGDPT
eukprot:6470622-Amphidinium_carterae.1